MTPDFTNSIHCGKPGVGLCVHCLTCLADREWRKNVGAPDVCPWGVTKENHAEKLAEAQKAREGPQWEKLFEPMQSAKPSLTQPGDLLAYVIHEVTGIAICGACEGRRAEINAWGWSGALQNVGTIYGWLKAECEKRKLTVKKTDVLLALVKAIKAGLAGEREKGLTTQPQWLMDSSTKQDAVGDSARGSQTANKEKP